MADPQLVKDVMVPTVQLEANATAHDALQELYQKNLEYGAVSDESGRLFAVVTREQLSAAKEDKQVHALTANMPHLVPIEPHDSLDTIVQTRSEDLVIDQDLMGIVVREQNDIRGILLRKTIEEYRQRIAATGGLSGSFLSDPRARGDPVGVGPRTIWFECSTCNVKINVNWQDYDPDNPPICNKGHVMKPIRVRRSTP